MIINLIKCIRIVSADSSLADRLPDNVTVRCFSCQYFLERKTFNNGNC